MLTGWKWMTVYVSVIDGEGIKSCDFDCLRLEDKVDQFKDL